MKGIFGLFSRENAAQKGLHVLYGVQHRGQESAGLSMAGDHSIRTWKGKGLVSNVFDKRYTSFTHPDDYMGIGCASGDKADGATLPPINLESERYELSLAMDGYILNGGGGSNDEIFGRVLLSNLEQQRDVEAATSATMK